MLQRPNDKVITPEQGREGGVNSTMVRGLVVVGVVAGITGQDRRDRSVRSKGKQVGRPGVNSLPFLGGVSGHGRTYK